MAIQFSHRELCAVWPASQRYSAGNFPGDQAHKQ